MVAGIPTQLLVLFIEPSPPLSLLARRSRRILVAGATLVLLATSFLIIGVWPVFLPDSYSWVEHTISESGGQGVPGAWILHLGIFLASVSAAGIWTLGQGVWSRGASIVMGFYVMAVGLAAVLTDEAWYGGPFDRTEAFLHTAVVVATGAAFALGMLLIRRDRPPAHGLARAYDILVTAVIATAPLLMLMAEPWDGLIQRSAVMLAYSWLFFETLRLSRSRVTTSATE